MSNAKGPKPQLKGVPKAEIRTGKHLQMKFRRWGSQSAAGRHLPFSGPEFCQSIRNKISDGFGNRRLCLDDFMGFFHPFDWGGDHDTW